MKTLKYALIFCLAVWIGLSCFTAHAEDDPWEDDTEPAVVTTTLPNTTVPDATLPTKPVTTEPTSAEPADVPAPLVRITRQSMPKKPAAGEAFTVTAVFHNYSSLSLLQGLAVFEPGDGLVLAEKSDSKVVPVIGPNGVAKVNVKLRALKEYSSTDIPVLVNYAYSYRTPQGIVSATADDKIIIPMQPIKKENENESAANATPNIIVSEYDYGGTIAAGDAFTLRLAFTNTSRKLAAENIMMSVDTGDGLSITGASNTYYYASLGAGKTAAQSIPMRVLTSAGAQGTRVEITFRYEYVDNGTRSSTSTSESLSIPIYAPDRFLLTEPDTELIGMQNEELAVSIPYVNKGKSEVSNVQARLIYDESVAYCEQPHINLGNFEPGKSGTIDFYFTPSEPGSSSVKIVVTYEDELMQEKTLTVSVPYSVDEAFADPGFYEEDMPQEPEPQSPIKKILLIGIPAAVVVLLIVLIVVLRKRKKKKADPSVSFDWSFAQTEDDAHENG